ncbi:uncharacterized protein LOC103114577 [Erinaceus europaeus]|uniref:Uncharacterized protein LOC103114577 n=1 Tax=Erinaceus europaeus TaxID=9365 RepID=A0ABM3XD69_ERIEU|nr:uncharacterized protein LOC103114577 [Erinaceus europaeus]
MDREKFQQKASKQTKQKKSKSAEFLMVKEEREFKEGTTNPAFCASSSDLSTYWSTEERMMGQVVRSHSLVSHPRGSRLPAAAKLKGNEYSRNYFDPLMDEEINPRQCGMEVSRKDKSLRKTPHSEEPIRSRKSPELPGDKATFACSVVSMRCAQKATVLPGWSSSQQLTCLPKRYIQVLNSQDLYLGTPLVFLESLQTSINLYCTNSYLRMKNGHVLHCNQELENVDAKIMLSPKKKQFHISPSFLRNVLKLVELRRPLFLKMKVAYFSQLYVSDEVGRPSPPQCFHIQVKCIWGLKNKAPQGYYILRMSLLEYPGGPVLHLEQSKHLETKTHSVKHNGNFYDVGLYFHEKLSMTLPSKKDVKPGMAFLFELVLLRGKYVSCDQVVGWSAFPLCDNNFGVVEGKFKCPLLRGHYDRKLDNFRKIEDLICLDMDHWLCNLYFQVIKLPMDLVDQKDHKTHTQFHSKFQVFLMPEEESDVDDTAGLSGKKTEQSTFTLKGSIANKIDPCPTDCGLRCLKEDHELLNKEEDLTEHSVKKKSTGWITAEMNNYSQDLSYLEELEKHKFSVYCSSVTQSGGSREFFKHLQFALTSIYLELQLSQWRSQGFWYSLLLVAAIWFLRLYLHYLGQWLFLWAISVPVTKFHFSLHTVELCYPASSLHMGQELFVVAAGPLALNTLILPWVLVRWGCQMLFASYPDVLSKLITTMALWTVLDPLAVFLIDTILGRLTQSGENPTADAAKLYWLFVRTMQPGILGVIITVILYTLLFIISSLILYLYCLRLNNNPWISDAFQRIHSEEEKFFIPYDLEISNQELSYIVKRSEQWRGINGERRKVAVYDYIWKSHGVESSASCCDLEHQNAIFIPALSPGDVTSHVSVYTIYPSGFQELYRHFLRLPSGAIVENYFVNFIATIL